MKPAHGIDLHQPHAPPLGATAWLTRDSEGGGTPPAALLIIAFILFVAWAAGSAEAKTSGYSSARHAGSPLSELRSRSSPRGRAASSALDAFGSVAVGTGPGFSVIADVESIAVETIVFPVQAELRIGIAGFFIAGMLNA